MTSPIATELGVAAVSICDAGFQACNVIGGALGLEGLTGVGSTSHAGAVSQVVFATGLLTAGLTSSVTAPLAAAFAISGAMGWGRDLASLRFRAVWLTIIVAGTLFAVFGGSPVEAIVSAQTANGLLLPFIAIVLLRVMNRRDLLGEHTNGIGGNIVAGVVVLVVSGLGILNLVTAFTG